jgi:hypothetical protein
MQGTKMNVRNHLKAFLIGTIAWVVIFVLGLPNYYQQYPTIVMVMLVLVGPLLLLATHRLGQRWLEGESYLAKDLLLAFCLTVPPFFCDLAYCGFYLGYGWGFLLKFWYRSVYYVLPWVLPLYGESFDQARRFGDTALSLLLPTKRHTKEEYLARGYSIGNSTQVLKSLFPEGDFPPDLDQVRVSANLRAPETGFLYTGSEKSEAVFEHTRYERIGCDRYYVIVRLHVVCLAQGMFRGMFAYKENRWWQKD